MYIIVTNVEELITAQGAIDEIHRHQKQCGKSKVNISLCRRKSYQRTYIENIRSRFDKVRPVISHIELSVPEKPLTPNNIDENLKIPHRQF